jgi:hypothetical protein
MSTVIRNTQVEVLKLDSQRMIFVNGSRIPYFMSFDEQDNAWKFTGDRVPEELRHIQADISDYIVASEKED